MHTNIPSSHNNLQTVVSYRLFASSTNNNNDDKDTTTATIDNNELASHYTSKSILSWLQKMADSYQVEEGEDLLIVLTREGSIDDDITEDTNNRYQLLKLAKFCAQTNLSIASHDFLRQSNKEAIYNYGNIAFLTNFGYEWDEFIELPSSKCVATQEDVNERQTLLDARLSNKVSSSSNNDTDDTSSPQYDNLIRVRKDGTQIVLKGVHLWNVYDITLQERQQEDEGSTSSSTLLEEVIRIRKQIEQGEIKAIGQAVWIQNVEPL